MAVGLLRVPHPCRGFCDRAETLTSFLDLDSADLFGGIPLTRPLRPVFRTVITFPSRRFFVSSCFAPEITNRHLFPTSERSLIPPRLGRLAFRQFPIQFRRSFHGAHLRVALHHHVNDISRFHARAPA